MLPIRHDGQITWNGRQALSTKIFCFTVIRFYVIRPPSPCRHEGRSRDRHESVARVAMDAAASGGFIPAGETLAAYGEVVWTWRRDPGVYPACLCGLGNGDNNGRSPGRARSKPPNHCAGKAGMSRLYLSNPCALFHYPLHTVLRAQSAPGFPCALYSREGHERTTTRAKLRRGNTSACAVLFYH